MCGIIGYIGDRETSKVLLDGLKRLEYRGYDSAGLTLKDRDRLETIKTEGKVGDLEKLVSETKIFGRMGIAHTRWATHGKVNTVNAHPHSTENISLVCNGIIENYQLLKQFLEEEGAHFESETDTEVLLKLIEYNYIGNLEKAVEKSLLLVDGSFGIAVISKKEDVMIAARRGSPLILGVGEKEFFVASDSTAIAEYTKKVVYLDDNDLAVMNSDSYSIKQIGKGFVNRDIQIIHHNLEQLQKNGYEHFMLKEIHDQVNSVRDTSRGRIKNSQTHLPNNLPFNNIQDIQRIIFLACGTSWHAGLVGEYLIEQYSRIPVEVEYASEFKYRNPIINPTDLVIAISQSGETADTLSALKEAQNKGAKTMGLVNVVGSSIARQAGTGIYLHAGPEIGVASTKAFTSQVTALAILAAHLGEEKKLGYKLEREELIAEIELLPEKIQETLKLEQQISRLMEQYNPTNMLYLGRGINFPTALEGALKMKEISYIHAEGYPAAEMKHGPIALIDENMPVVFIATEMNCSCDKIISNMQEVKSRGGSIIAITTSDYRNIQTIANHTIYVPKTIEALSPIINSIPLQLMSYYKAVQMGRNVDQPRNLAKSVTVE